jgi:hypothetical protein
MRRQSFLLFVLSSSMLAACSGSSKNVVRAAAPSAPPPPSYPAYGQPTPVPTSGAEEQSSDYHHETLRTASDVSLRVASTDAAPAPPSGGGGGGSAPTTPQPPQTVEPNPREMLDIEARLSIEVEKVADAAARVRELAASHGGQIVADTVTDESGSTGGAFTIRVPSRGSSVFLEALSGVGIVRSRQVTARDIGKEFHDAQIHLRNLEVTLKRYEEILAKAQDVKQILEIEREMQRIRGEIDRVKGDLRWMSDRAARATIYLTLFSARPDVAPTFAPEAKIYPGIRGFHLADFRDGQSAGYLGAGLSIAFARWWSFDIDGARRIGGDGRGLDLFMITGGGETYSDFLGGGRRTWFNPYVGLRVGYARLLGHDEVVLGGTVGLEIYKTKVVRFDLQSRLLGFFGNRNVGGHLAVQPAVTLHVAF